MPILYETDDDSDRDCDCDSGSDGDGDCSQGFPSLLLCSLIIIVFNFFGKMEYSGEGPSSANRIDDHDVHNQEPESAMRGRVMHRRAHQTISLPPLDSKCMSMCKGQWQCLK